MTHLVADGRNMAIFHMFTSAMGNNHFDHQMAQIRRRNW